MNLGFPTVKRASDTLPGCLFPLDVRHLPDKGLLWTPEVPHCLQER